MLLVILNLIVFSWLFLRSPQHRWPVVIMMTGMVAGRMLFLLDRLNFLRIGLHLDLLGMSIEFLRYAMALFGFRIFDPIPLPRRTAIEQLHSGMLVLDTQGVIAGLPDPETLEAVWGYPLLRIDRNGWIHLTTDREKMWVEVERR